MSMGIDDQRRTDRKLKEFFNYDSPVM